MPPLDGRWIFAPCLAPHFGEQLGRRIFRRVRMIQFQQQQLAICGCGWSLRPTPVRYPSRLDLCHMLAARPERPVSVMRHFATYVAGRYHFSLPDDCWHLLIQY